MANRLERAKLQLIDNYIKSSSIQVHKKESSNTDLELGIEVSIADLKELDNRKRTANLILKQTAKIMKSNNGEILTDIEVQMVGNFIGTDLNETEFLQMIKYNGTPTLSQIIRSYVITMTSVGGIEPVRLPMINFVDFFKEKDEK